MGDLEKSRSAAEGKIAAVRITVHTYSASVWLGGKKEHPDVAGCSGTA